MTVPLPTQVNPSKPDAAAARKRRRRAPAGGAADDCFTCSKRNTKCDRRRPYCSQCLEIGNECSGYKTQLTWGVGVASRGKLRGLSLPIAKAPPVNPVKKTSPTTTTAAAAARPRTDSTASTSQWADGGSVSPRTRRVDVEMVREHHHQHHHHASSSVPPTPAFPGFNFSAMSQPEAAPSISQAGWSHMPFSTSLPADGGLRFQKLAHSMPGHGDPLDALSDVDYMSPMNPAFSREEVPFMHSPTTIMYEPFTGHSSPVPQSPITAMMIEQRAPPTSCPGLVYATSEPSSSLQSHGEHFDPQLGAKILQDCDSLGTPDLDAYSTSAHSNGHFWGPSTTDEDASSHGGGPESHGALWPMTDMQPMPLNPELLAKMPFFMDYYENTMCPSMVFIDGPNNPFRDHIMQLASTSRSLQHAICALAACNLRTRRKLSLGQHGRDLGDGAADVDGQPEDQSLSEEYQHRNLAVHLLNEQLNDAAKAKHDSVLATILMLCHYRMAESGIAKFHTQFAGVKKILAMRRSSSSPFSPSRESAWMESLFTYFDAISASVNERECQLNTSFYGVMPDAQLLAAGAENLVGCDRELFKTIIKLGRLNLLSQHRPVQNLLQSRGASSRSQSPLDSSPLGQAFKSGHHHLGAAAAAAAAADPYGIAQPQPQHQQSSSLSSSQPSSRFDGNGFGTTLDDDEMMSAALCSPPAYDDHRSTFWREWKDARIALQSWEFDPQRLLASLPAGSPPTASQVRDLGSLSEAFRYAALLYTERLASPTVPSAHNNFRNLVSQVIYYATSLEASSSAEKFLLWPLFIAGSECVNELQQNIVRNKCREIMARSGYMNNLSALDVLERLWAGDWKEDNTPGSKLPGMMRHGPFNWTKCIGGAGIEVEWIMF